MIIEKWIHFNLKIKINEGKEGISINLIFHNHKFQGFKSYTNKQAKNFLFYLIFFYICVVQYQLVIVWAT